MATVRFFAQAREAAGTGTAVITGASVGEVLDSAVAQYGNICLTNIGKQIVVRQHCGFR